MIFNLASTDKQNENPSVEASREVIFPMFLGVLMVCVIGAEILGLRHKKSQGIINKVCRIRASVDALCRDGAGLISRERVQRGRLTRQGTTS